mgnify:CR=1 FL=1
MLGCTIVSFDLKKVFDKVWRTVQFSEEHLFTVLIRTVDMRIIVLYSHILNTSLYFPAILILYFMFSVKIASNLITAIL